MMQLLVFRERVKNFYQRYDAYLKPVIKFIFAFIVFSTINRELGFDQKLGSIQILLAVSLLSAFTPSAVMVLLASGAAVMHVYSLSPLISAIIIIIMLILYLLFIRYTPGQGYVVVAVPVLYALKIPYTIPILMGLAASPVSIVPICCGVIIYYLFQVIKSAAAIQVNMDIDAILQLYTYVINNLIGNRQMIMTLVIFSLILLVTYFVRRMKFDYAFEISIAAGALTSILGFLVSDLILNKSDMILSMILGTLISGSIVYVIHFFRLTLDYSGVEHAQFEDDVYYYYVKAVPKMTVTAPQMHVKHINVKASRQKPAEEEIAGNDFEDFDDEDIYQDQEYQEEDKYLKKPKADKSNGKSSQS